MTAVSEGWSQRCHRTVFNHANQFPEQKTLGGPFLTGSRDPSDLNSPPGAACPHPGHEEGPKLPSTCGRLTAPTQTGDKNGWLLDSRGTDRGDLPVGGEDVVLPPGWVPRQEAGGVCWTLGRAPCSPDFQIPSRTVPHPRASSSH